MGLVRELVDEIIPLPRQMDSTIEKKNEVISVYRINYAFMNMIFQLIDCVVIPIITIGSFKGVFDLGWMNWIVIIVGGTSSFFSILQSVYYFVSPPEKYLDPIKGRIFGETAIGAFIASLFKIKLITLIK